jgi:chemotaxis protein histidine kinase CheA
MKAAPQPSGYGYDPGTNATVRQAPVNVDPCQLLEVFYDETAEHLTELELALRALDTRAPDPAGLELMYRTARSAKASSITLGLVDVAELVEQLEGVLDRLRRHQLRVNTDVREAGVEASTVLRALLAAHRGTGAVETACTERAQRRLQAVAGRCAAEAASPAAARTAVRSELPDGTVPPAGWRGQGRRGTGRSSDRLWATGTGAGTGATGRQQEFRPRAAAGKRKKP